MAKLEEIVKAGPIGLAQIGVGGDIPEADAQKLIDLIVQSSTFMKLVSTAKSKEFIVPFSNLRIDGHVLQNVPEGLNPTETVGSNNPKSSVEIKLTNAFIDILFSVLFSAKGKTAQKEIQTQVVKQMSEDITTVGFVGTEWVERTSDITKINKGWITLAKESSDTGKVNANLHKDTDGNIVWENYLAALIATLPGKYKNKQSVKIIMNPADFDKYVHEMSAKNGGISFLIGGDVPSFMGYKIVQEYNMPEGHVLFSNPKNLLFGMNTNVKNDKTVNSKKRVLELTYTMGNGYGISVDKALVIGWDQG